RATAETAVRGGNMPAALMIPKGFGETPISFGRPDRPKLLLLADTADPVAPPVVSGLLQGVAARALPDVMARAGVEEIERWGGPLTPEQRARLEANIQVLRGRRVSGSPGGGGTGGGLVDVEVKDVLGATKKNPTSALIAAGLGVMFLLFSAAGAGGALVEEGGNGALARVLSTPVSLSPVLLGKAALLLAGAPPPPPPGFC